MSRPDPFTGHALITGGSSGIGRATAERLVARGMDLTLIARRADLLAETAGALEPHRRRADQRILTRTADVADRPAVEAAMFDAIDRLGPPELLITSAGIAEPGYFADVPLETFERTMAVNYFGTLYCVRAALPAMRARGRGRVVLVSSGAGLIGLFGYTPYAPSKFALRGLAESLRGELKRDGIGVSIVYPPDTDTPQLAAESRTKPPETKRITGTARTWSAEAVADCIVHGVKARRFAICPGWEMAALNRLHSLINPLLQGHFDRLAAREARP